MVWVRGFSKTMQHLPCAGPVRRREFLRAGGLLLGGLTLSDILAGRAAAGRPRHDTSVILLYLHGGPSHLETYDLKPRAPQEYRSVFRPIRTTVPGMEICELFPLQAEMADKFSLVRSLHHDVGIHSDGGIVVLTGKRPRRLDPTSQSVSQHPDVGSIAGYCRSEQQPGAPPYVAIPRKPYMTRPSYLGVQHGAFEVGDPSAENFRPPNMRLIAGIDGTRLGDRRCLLAQLDALRRNADRTTPAGPVDAFHERAFQLLTSRHIAEAFAIDREGDQLRDRYGRHLWGQSCLLARRLAEAGTAVVSLFINTPKSGKQFTNWDDHVLNAGRPGHFGEYMERRLPYLDQALSALIRDIYDRGIDQRILVVVVGEFGRTPRLRENSNGVGRDHWPQAYSALVSGGGLRMGQVIGATNARGEFPVERPYSPQDLLATVYRHLGIDYHATLTDFSGRPVPILHDGAPIAELI